MKGTRPRISSALAIGIFLTLVPSGVNAAGAIRDEKLEAQVRKAADRGVKWLRTMQKDDGSWEHHPGLTALALSAVANASWSTDEKSRAAIDRSSRYLESMIKPDGAIYDRDLPVYNTSVSVMALCATGNPKFAPAILKARQFLVGQQEDEERGVKPSDPAYGGIGYGDDDPKPDLSNLQFAIEGLRATSLDANDPAWNRAIAFLQRCQNRSESNDQAWAGNDGGFVYSPGESKAGGTKSYGSMTYAAIKSMIYANLSKDDPRVQAAMDWIKKNYTLEENPQMGAAGLFYYYCTFAKALRAFGEPEIVDEQGKKHLWANELARKLLSLQSKEGSWMNTKSSRWWEGNKVLVTSETIFALEETLSDLGPAKDSCPALTAAASKGTATKDSGDDRIQTVP